MFNNIGAKIKGLAIGTFIVETLGALITGICLWADWGDTEGFLLFLAIGVGGSLVAWISSWFIYGYGELIENTGNTVTQIKSIDQKLDSAPSNHINTKDNASKNSSTNNSILFKDKSSDSWKCKTCGKTNKYYVGTCGCGQSRIEN